MSLTRHLSDSSSAVRAWVATTLPHTSPLAGEANRTLRVGLGPTPGGGTGGALASTPALPGSAVDPQVVGTALDLLVRATLATRAWSAAPTRGASRIAGEGISGAIEIARQTGDGLRELAPAQLAPDAREWRDVAALCVLLARFEQAGRSRRATEWAVERLRAAEPTIDGYAVALVDARDVEDAAAAAPAITADHADLRVAEPLWPGPRFALSAALGGADADLIAGGLLLDLKATTTARIVGRTELWQLAGYALADTDDTYGVRDVGVSAMRWRRRWIIGLDELVLRLAGRPLDIARLRREFADIVAAATPFRARADRPHVPPAAA